MIVYKLKCSDGHEFETWFSSSAAYEHQAAEGQIVCPVCGRSQIEKAVMAPAISGTKNRTLSNEDAQKLRKFMAGVRNQILENSENVGQNFPEEVRKIHYGEAPQRQIYGETTVQEAKALTEEGIDILPLPPAITETFN